MRSAPISQRGPHRLADVFSPACATSFRPLSRQNAKTSPNHSAGPARLIAAQSKRHHADRPRAPPPTAPPASPAPRRNAGSHRAPARPASEPAAASARPRRRPPRNRAPSTARRPPTASPPHIARSAAPSSSNNRRADQRIIVRRPQKAHRPLERLEEPGEIRVPISRARIVHESSDASSSRSVSGSSEPSRCRCNSAFGSCSDKLSVTADK